jgi:hypothetical protein
VKKISSGSTYFTKRVFPFLWFGFLAVFSVIAVIAMLNGVEDASPAFLLIPAAMAVFGFFLMKALVWNLADEVYDGGDFLLVRWGGREERVSLSNVVNVNASVAVNPPRITLRLAKPGKFGEEISFSPVSRFQLNPFGKNPVAEDLILRIDCARLRRADR